MLKLYFPRVENRVFERVWERVKFILMILCILGSFFYIVFNCQLHYNVDVEGQMPLQLIISDDMPKTFYIFEGDLYYETESTRSTAYYGRSVLFRMVYR